MENRKRQIVVVVLMFLLMIAAAPIIGTQSDLALTSSYEAELLGLKHDEGVDTDADGKFDYLIVGVEVNVSGVGFYEIQVSGLLDSYSSYIQVYGSEYSLLDVGLHVLNVSLNGNGIYVSGLNPSNVSSIELYGGEYEWEIYYIGSLWNVPLSKEYLYTDFDPPAAMLTGKIHDEGVDTDADGNFNYLEVDVEINVTESGDYSVEVYGLRDIYWYGIDVWGYESGYFEVGLGWLNVSLSGYRIRASRINASFVSQIYLYADYLSSIDDVPLSVEYLYTQFDVPAVLTGVIDSGVDTDGDGSYDYLEVDVQVDVSDPGNYEVSVSGLLDESFNHIDVYSGVYDVYLETGLHVVNLSLAGWRIYLSGCNPMYIQSVSLRFWEEEYRPEDYWHDQSVVPLSEQYYYTQFDPPGAMLTGNISDQGVDTDADLKFDYLEVGVEVDVTEAGTYVLHVSGLLGAEGDWSYIYVWDSKTTYLDVGVQTVNLYLYGPQIYVSNQNPVNVSYIGINDEQYTYYDSIYDVPLSGEYSYTDFDAPFLDVETKFVVYPDGRVAVEGALKYTNMYPEYTGPTMQGSFNLTSTQASAGLTLTLPPEEAPEFPFNSITADLLATYSDGLLNTEMNSTMILSSAAESLYPFNTTDGTITVTYSEGILNIEVEGNTTLPSIASSQFPFNATDLTVVGTYSPHTLDGTITFSVLPDFTFDDINVDFTGNQTDLTLNGTVHVVFNVPFNGFIIHNDTELNQMIDQLKSDLVGEDGIVWNMTGGLLNVTNLDIGYVLNGIGADVTFRMDVHGDFVRALAYVMSGGRNEMLLYPVLNEAYESVLSGSFDIQYDHNTLEASVNLSFSYDVESLMNYILTPPEGTTPYIMASYSMSPTIYLGDLVFVEAVSNAGDVNADPDTGDIIAFEHPTYSGYIIIHRAINKTLVDGTWYFQTKGDANYSPDYWTENNTYNGMVSENCLIGNVTSRIPLLGYLLSYPYSVYYAGYYIPYLQSTVAPRMSLMKAVFSSVQSMSLQLSYSSVDKRFDFQYTQVDKLNALRDELALILPELLPPETPPEFKSIIESLLNTTYASVTTAQASLSYENGKADFKATATIEGDLNAELNYVKDLYFQLVGAQYSRYNMTIPWQLDFLNQTQVDVSNLSISAKLDTTSFEGRIEGLTLLPPIDIINATHFMLERFFNLTAPQYSWQQEFPGQNQKLKITVEGGSNATHMVTLFRPPTVPEPDLTEPYGKSMVWFNQTLSSLKDLVFKIGPYITGTLTVSTTPVDGDIYVDGEYKATGYWSEEVEVGNYTISFGDVAGYYAPSDQVVTVNENEETLVEGIYEEKPPANGTLTISTTPVAGDIYVDGEYKATGYWSEEVEVGNYTISFGPVEDYSTPDNQTVEVSEGQVTQVTGVYEPVLGVVVEEITEPELVNATNPFVVNATEEAATSLIITEISDAVMIKVKKITDPVGVEPPPGTWEVLGNYVQITVNNTDITVNATIRIYYTLEQLEASGLDENTLKIHYWNTTLDEWIAVESHVNTEEHFVWANINHFSVFAIMGQPSETAVPFTTQLWFLAIAGIAVAIIAIVTVIVIMRKRKTLHPAPESAQNK